MYLNASVLCRAAIYNDGRVSMICCCLFITKTNKMMKLVYRVWELTNMYSDWNQHATKKNIEVNNN